MHYRIENNGAGGTADDHDQLLSIVVVALLFLGGSALRGFSEALLIGILIGTYSSIYISSSVALDFGLKAEHLFPTIKKTAVDHLP